MEFFPHDANYPFIPKMKVFIGISIALCVFSILAVAIHGLNFGIDFAGGYEIQARFPGEVSDNQIREAVPNAHVQRYGDEANHEFLILVHESGMLGETEKQKLKADFEQLSGNPDGLANWAVAESGENIHVGFDKPVTEEQVRGILGKYNLKVKGVTRTEREDRPEFTIQLASLADEIEQSLRAKFSVPAETPIVSRVEFVGPQVGAELRMQGVMAVVYSLLLILLYIAVRFDFFFSPGAIVATLHDIILVMGFYAVTGIEFNLQAIAAILTLIGYSLNDTVVVYDRIRENMAKMRGRDLRSLVNASINQTMSRTVLTSGVTSLVVIALWLLGGGVIKDFALAMLFGIVAGTYSSIAIASPVYILLRERSGKGPAKAAGGVVAA